MTGRRVLAIFRRRTGGTMHDLIKVTLPGGREARYPRGTTAGEVLRDWGKVPFGEILAARVDGRLVDLSSPLMEDTSVEPLTFGDLEGREIYWHSSAHILAQAVQQLFPEAKLGIGPAIREGFYYDFDVPEPFSEEDLGRIEERMREIIRQDLPFIREEVPRPEAIRLMSERKERYKVELLEEDIEEETVSLYRQGEFVDLCRGPHVPSTGYIKAVKLLSVAGAYWKGDERRPMLQRIYGISFPSQEELEEFLRRREEVERRDHRRLGKQLDLFSIQEEGGPGLVYWHPKGARIRAIIEDFWRREHYRRGYELVYTPHIAKVELWERSGHMAWFKESMFPPMEVEEQGYLLKPMNCPFHILMYKSKTRSYRDLPIRWAELGTVYRYERSGVLQGMLRVRGFTQDDAHIFCRPDQLEDEILGVLDLAEFMLTTFGYTEYEVELSVRDPEAKEKYIGDDAVWEQAEEALIRALEQKGWSYSRREGEAKFYGPAIDIKMLDALGRGWQGPTIQVDFNEPERFDVTYIGEDGAEHRVVMVHRTVLGSMERFVGGLIEHYGGAFPAWLAPVQVVVIPITDAQVPYAHEIGRRLLEEDFRAEVDDRNERVGYKIREAELQKVPYMLVVGKREVAEGTVSVRKRGEGDIGRMNPEEFIDRLREEVEAKL